jgi:hypothetical protein
LRQKLAAADKAEAEAMVKMRTAPDDIAKAQATREYEQAQAKKEKVQADTELQTRLSDIGFKQAQINKFKVETRNLDTQGKMLSLDFQAAAQGLPLPSKKTEGGGGTATEDERKAAGWLAQLGDTCCSPAGTSPADRYVPAWRANQLGRVPLAALQRRIARCPPTAAPCSHAASAYTAPLGPLLPTANHAPPA